MRRRTNPLPVRIYTYGLPLGVTQGADLVEDQVDAGRAYYNALIEIERKRRAAYRALMGEQRAVETVDAKIATLVEQLANARAALSERRASARKRVVDKTASAAIAQLRAEIKIARGERKAAQLDARQSPRVKAKLAKLEAEAKTAAKAARAATTCYWGTYLLIERSIEAARKATVDPRFRRWNAQGFAYDKNAKRRVGAGRIGVQLQGGLTVAGLLAGLDTRARLIGAPDTAQMATRSGRRHARPTLQIRVGSDGRAPVWASFTLALHRLMPADGVIKEISVARRQVADRWRWEARFSIEAASFAVELKKGRKRCAIDLGWRVRPAGLRVGYLVGNDRRHHEILLPYQITSALDHAGSLRAIRRRNFNLQQAVLVQWLASQTTVPEWLAEAGQFLSQWQSETRLTDLTWQWTRNRFAGDGDIYPPLEAWRRQELHLLQWEGHERSRAMGRRREHYRVLAREIATRYDVIVLEQLDLRALKRLPAPEQDDPAHQAVRRNQTYAALGELRAALILAASNTGTAIRYVPSHDTTSLCHACGAPCKWDHAAELEHTCEHCGERWDQDHNAGENLLASGTAPRGGRAPLADRANA